MKYIRTVFKIFVQGCISGVIVLSLVTFSISIGQDQFSSRSSCAVKDPLENHGTCEDAACDPSYVNLGVTNIWSSTRFATVNGLYLVTMFLVTAAIIVHDMSLVLHQGHVEFHPMNKQLWATTWLAMLKNKLMARWKRSATCGGQCITIFMIIVCLLGVLITVPCWFVPLALEAIVRTFQPPWTRSAITWWTYLLAVFSFNQTVQIVTTGFDFEGKLESGCTCTCQMYLKVFWTGIGFIGISLLGCLRAIMLQLRVIEDKTGKTLLSVSYSLPFEFAATLRPEDPGLSVCRQVRAKYVNLVNSDDYD